MKKQYFSSLLCITILACIPACKKHKNIPNKEIKKTIEIDSTVIEVEKIDNEEKLVVKF